MNNNNNEIIWKAFADPTRRTILDQLREGPKTTGHLCGHFPDLSRFAVMKHLGILHDAGLVIIKRQGKYRWNFINAAPIQDIYERWMSRYTAPLAASALRLKKTIEQGGEKMSEKKAILAEVGATQIELQVTIQADLNTVWRAIVDETGSWWRRDFHVYSESKMTLEARPGGRLIEQNEAGEGGVWYTVQSISPPTLIELVGHLGPRYGGPLTSILLISLQPQGDTTVVNLSDALYGSIQDKMKSETREGWRMLIEEGLKSYIEG